MDKKQLEQLAIEVAASSPCSKRKVGAVIYDKMGVVATGKNHNPTMGVCEDPQGQTYDSTIHAEIDAIANANGKGTHMLVTHPPCEDCLKAIKEAGLSHSVVASFMKFDFDKLNYNLIPPSNTKALATILTYGAKKYKPNNWKKVKDKSQYVSAAMRHLEAYRAGEKLDQESGYPHLWHLLTNIGFLVELDK